MFEVHTIGDLNANSAALSKSPTLSQEVVKAASIRVRYMPDHASTVTVGVRAVSHYVIARARHCRGLLPRLLLDLGVLNHKI
ncbi:hypothetical protein J6590_027172 [Homalodisca vitripennis]|nr:hypothetical protein J6590_027172 [Homalodisca vitripennis]